MPDNYVTAMAAANSILSLGFERHVDITPMKLQRLLYLVYCGYMKRTGRKLFRESFYVWAYGPVIQSVYWKFQCFRSSPIDRYAKDAMGIIESLDPRSSASLRHVLSDVAELYLPMDAKSLCELVRADGTAWDKAYRAHAELLDDEDVKADGCFAA